MLQYHGVKSKFSTAKLTEKNGNNITQRRFGVSGDGNPKNFFAVTISSRCKLLFVDLV